MCDQNNLLAPASHKFLGWDKTKSTTLHNSLQSIITLLKIVVQSPLLQPLFVQQILLYYYIENHLELVFLYVLAVYTSQELDLSGTMWQTVHNNLLTPKESSVQANFILFS